MSTLLMNNSLSRLKRGEKKKKKSNCPFINSYTERKIRALIIRGFLCQDLFALNDIVCLYVLISFINISSLLFLLY